MQLNPVPTDILNELELRGIDTTLLVETGDLKHIYGSIILHLLDRIETLESA